MKKILIILLLFASKTWALSVTQYVDPAATGAGDGSSWTDAYTSLSAWEGQNRNLVTETNDLTVLVRSSDGTDDTTACTISGWTTNATYDITIRQDDFPADGIYDDTKYVLKLTDPFPALGLNADYVTIDGLQLNVTASGANNVIGVYVSAVGATSSHVYGNVILKGTSSTTGYFNGMYCNDSSAVITAFNCVVYDVVNGADAEHRGYRCGQGTFSIYNSVAYNCYSGFSRSGGTMTATNCISGNNTDDHEGTITVTYACDDDNDSSTGNQSPNTNWTTELNDPANGDFRILAASNSLNNGTDDPSSGVYSDDIIGTSRSSTWSIGAYEDAYSAGASIPIIQYYRSQQ